MAKKNRQDTGGPPLADQADRFFLYEHAVQCVEAEIDFVDKTFRTLRGRRAHCLREDFCGTANTSYEWIRRRRTNRAYSVDIDPKVLEWSKRQKCHTLPRDQRERIHIVNADVLKANTPPADILLAMNFSYWLFKSRPAMLQYFSIAWKNLVEDGVFFLDAYGGYEAFQEMEEKTEYDEFTYVWDQHSYNPINGQAECRIHFEFKDGSRLKNAFRYSWRLWTLAEITEMLTTVGFKATVYWEGTNRKGEGNGIYTPSTRGEADTSWIAYIVAEKQASPKD